VDAHRIASVPATGVPSRDVYCYFDNDAKVRAPFDAQNLMGKVGASIPAARRLTPPKRFPGAARSGWPAVRRSS
jgi:hypothetical protein